MNYELFYPGIHKIILKIQNLNHLTLCYIIIQGVLYGQVGIFHIKTINEHLYHKRILNPYVCDKSAYLSKHVCFYFCFPEVDIYIGI